MKRLRDSARAAITFKPLRASSRQSGGGGSRLSKVSKAARDRFDRRERIVHLVTEHAHDALPGVAFFFAQRLAQIGQHHQLVRHAMLAKSAPPHAPAARSLPGNVERERRVLVRFQHDVEIQIAGASA